jgi:hypothetical protein
MRQSKNLEIDDKKITVYELTAKEIIEIGEQKEVKEGSADLNNFKEILNHYLPKAVSGVTLDDLIGMPPSDIKKVYEEFKVVNSVFFEAARSMGLDELLNQLKGAVQRDFLKLLVGSLPGDSQTP